jgi:hypothetical protein
MRTCRARTCALDLTSSHEDLEIYARMRGRVRMRWASRGRNTRARASGIRQYGAAICKTPAHRTLFTLNPRCSRIRLSHTTHGTVLEGKSRMPPAPKRRYRSPKPLPMLRTSERGTLKFCEFAWDLAYNRRVKMATEAPALRFGSLIHAALADWYIPGTRRGKHPAKAFKKHYDADMKRNQEIFGARIDEDETWVNAEELGLAMMTAYVEEYGTDPEWEVLVTEMPFQVIVPHPETGANWFMYTGVLDGVWKNRRKREIWIPDHKTTRAIQRKLSYLQMDDQAGAYWSFGLEYLVQNQFLKNNRLNGMLYNFLRKGLPDERPSKIIDNQRVYLNQDGSISKKQPPPLFLRQPIFRDAADRQETIHRALVDYDRIEKLRSGELELTKSPGQFTCPMCAMSDICELHETGHDWEAFISQTTKPWEPYAEHEIYDGR